MIGQAMATAQVEIDNYLANYDEKASVCVVYIPSAPYLAAFTQPRSNSRRIVVSTVANHFCWLVLRCLCLNVID